jgi:hypothetical protein
VLDEPGEPLRRARQLEHLEAQAGPGQRAAVGAQRSPPGRELLEHVADDAVVGGRRRAEHRDPGPSASSMSFTRR